MKTMAKTTTLGATYKGRGMVEILGIGTESATHAEAYRTAANMIDALRKIGVACTMPEIRHIDSMTTDLGSTRTVVRVVVECVSTLLTREIDAALRQVAYDVPQLV